jgi:hypothetical protein
MENSRFTQKTLDMILTPVKHGFASVNISRILLPEGSRDEAAITDCAVQRIDEQLKSDYTAAVLESLKTIEIKSV